MLTKPYVSREIQLSLLFLGNTLLATFAEQKFFQVYSVYVTMCMHIAYVTIRLGVLIV